jgi:hypothetical protein
MRTRIARVVITALLGLGAATARADNARNLQILGFENPADWSTSNGSKSASSDASQGAAALAIGGFSYTQLISAPLSTVAGAGRTLLLDVKPPAVPAWGQIQVFVNIPSRGIYYAPSNTVLLAGLPAGQYSTLSFTLPDNAVAALQQSYSDLTFIVGISVPTSQTWLFDALRFQGTGAGSLIQVRATGVDDFLYVTVDGVRRKVWGIGDPEVGQLLDASAWFGAGANTVRVQAANTGGPASYSLEIWVDGQLVATDSAPGDLATSAPVGIVVDHTLTVSTPNRPPFQAVQLTSATPGALYVNKVYTGLTTPATLTLPQGSYTFGLGVSQDLPFNYTGSYYEQAVNVTGSTTSVNLTAGSPLPVQKTASMVIIPIQSTYNYVTSLGRPDASNAGVLQQSDIAPLLSEVEATRTVWLKPLSYGLADWSVTVLPMVTSTPLYEESPDGLNLDRFLQDAGLDSLRQQYDRIVFYFSQQRADGTNVQDPIGTVFAVGRQFIGFQSSYTRLVAANQPNPYFLHETLHNNEAYESDILHEYNGVNGLHGAEQHGYYSEGSSGETDFLRFYRAYMRGQVAELDGMRPDISWPSVPTTADLYVGVFDTWPVFTGK